MPAPDRPEAHADRLYRTGGWVGVSPREAFADFSGDEAAARPVPGAHTAWELLLHLALWHEGAAARLRGEAFEQDSDAGEDWPEMPAVPTDAAWQHARERLDATFGTFAAEAARFDPARLDDAVPGHAFTFREMVAGVGEHALYHAAQARLLRRAL